MSITRCSAPSIPRRRAASTITGERSVAITRAPAAAERLGDVAGAAREVEHECPTSTVRAPRRAPSVTGALTAVTVSRSASQPDRRGIPAPAQLLLRLYAATPLNCGRMSRP